MSSPASGSDPDAYSLLRAFLQPQAGPTPRPGVRVPEGSALQRLLPSGGTLPWLERRWGEAGLPAALLSALRGLGQVIFINNPVSGLLLLLALLLQSPWMALFAAAGTLTANLTARAIDAEPPALSNGLYGFNGALVGAALAAFAHVEVGNSMLAWLAVVVAGAIVTTLLLHGLGRWVFRAMGLPPLTLPFCLVTWLLLDLVASLNHPTLQLAEHPALQSGIGVLEALLLALPHGFGQVLFCPGLLPGLLVLLATAVASPLAALVGLLGGGVAAITGLLIGASPEAVGVGLWSYNGVLTAIAIGGTFFAPTRLSVLVGLVGAAAASLLTPGLSQWLGKALAPGFPLLNLPFIVATLAMLLVIRWSLPKLLPVALHAIYTPEEHRRRYEVSRALLGDFRQRLRAVVEGRHRFVPSALAPDSGDALEREAAGELRRLYHRLDDNGNGRLSVAELATGLMQRQRGGKADLLNRSLFQRLRQLLAAMDVDGDGAVDEDEFMVLMLRLRRLSEGEERLMRYLMPVDVNGDDQLDPAELRRLFGSVGQPPLTPQEERHLFGPVNGRLSWSAFIDRLLLV
jgi:urea transporter/Ca2+-binding EF-hand superfamily protein